MAATDNFSVRRALPSDVPAIMLCAADNGGERLLRSRWGEHLDVAWLVESSLLSLVGVTENFAASGTTQRVVGFFAVNDFPSHLPTVHPAQWFDWFRALTTGAEQTIDNTLWLLCFVGASLLEDALLQRFFASTFATLPAYDFITFSVPGGMRPFPPMVDFMQPLRPKMSSGAHADDSAVQFLRADRSTGKTPHLPIRIGRAEDNDDLDEIFRAQLKKQPPGSVKQEFSQYFIAELIDSQAEPGRHSQVLVGEKTPKYNKRPGEIITNKPKPKAKGMLALTSKFNRKKLEENFDLRAYNNLLKVAPPRPAAPTGPVVLGSPAHRAATAAPAPAQPATTDGEEGLNAFCVTLFLIQEKLDSRAIDFLKPAFDLEMFKHLDYLVLTAPHTAPESSLMSYFSVIPPLPTSSFNQTLYILSRQQVTGSFSVSQATSADAAQVAALLQRNPRDETNPHAATLRQQLLDSVSAPEDPARDQSICLVLRCGPTVVGAACLRDLFDVEALRQTVNLDEFLQFELHAHSHHALLDYLVVDAQFHRRLKYFVREIFRIRLKTCVYMRVWNGETIPRGLLQEFVALRPRSQIEEPGTDDSDTLYCSTFLMTRKFLGDNKTRNSTRIVVIGASDAGLAFCETLAMLPYVDFTNVVLVSPGGLPRRLHPSPGRTQSFLPHSLAFSRGEYERLGLGLHVLALPLIVTSIDRWQKDVMLSNGTVLPYDTLILTPGLQDVSAAALLYPNELNGVFSISTPEDVIEVLHFLKEQPKAVGVDVGRACIIQGNTMETVTACNGLLECGVDPHCIIICRPHNDAPADAQIDIFNNDELHALVMEQLQQLGVRVHDNVDLVAVEGQDSLQTCVFMNRDPERPNPDMHVGDATPVAPSTTPKQNPPTDEPVPSHDGTSPRRDTQAASQQDADSTADADDAEEEDDDEYLNHHFGEEEETKPSQRDEDPLCMRVPAGLLLCCQKKDVDGYIFQALNDNMLVYDGRLVIDHRFRTADKSIFAGGTVTKFSRRYCKAMSLEFYNSREVGTRLAVAVLQLLQVLEDPHGEAASADVAGPSKPQPRINTAGSRHSTQVAPRPPLNESLAQHRVSLAAVPEFNKPVACSALLPGGLHYFHVALPALPRKMTKARKAEAGYGRDLVTPRGATPSPRAHPRHLYTRIHIDKYDCIDSLTYLGTEPVDCDNLTRLIGLPQMFCNQLVERFEEEPLIADLIDFLHEPWAQALYHDQFEQFRAKCLELLLATPDGQKIQMQFQKCITNHVPINPQLRAKLRGWCEPTTRQSILQALVEYIDSNRTQLTNYYLPSRFDSEQ
eukprot:gnl/Spiro4/6975_TR3618_c0_g1_i1.p1 gnl/Spiro4/6975_TR3618_c0_g1~~gnl/Spiro4/6975_TR3618_c0_g1_i1.p1  ORF type:complete len:1307 (+),score=476.75 gnl/Spiro4/6975_TR3618_c0_g1_i1:92-4012(+)